MDTTAAMPTPELDNTQDLELDQMPELDQDHDPEFELDSDLDSDELTWVNPKFLAAAAAATALVALVITAASLTIAVSARSQAQAALQSRDETQAQAAEALRSAATMFDTLAQTQLAVNVTVDEVVPIEASLPLNQTYEIPLETTVQVQQNVTTTVQIPQVFGNSRPTEIQIPLDLQVPIDTVVPFTFDEPIDLSTETRIQAEVPVELNLAETELAPLARDVGDELTDLAVILERAR